MHGRLTPGRAERLGCALSEEPEAVYLDSGDAVGFGNLDIRPWDRALERLSALGCAAMAMGNREFHPWTTAGRWKVSRASFPILCGNVTVLGEPVPWLHPSRMFTTASGLRVAVFGLTLPIVRPGSWHERVSRFRFEAPVTAAVRLAGELRPQCDLVVALTHMGLTADRELADRVPGVDLILGGHAHAETQRLEWRAGTCICHSGGYAHYATRLEVHVGGPGRVGVARHVVNLR